MDDVATVMIGIDASSENAYIVALRQPPVARGFLLETAQTLGIRREVLGQNLDG
jgi:hypothetical protein